MSSTPSTGPAARSAGPAAWAAVAAGALAGSELRYGLSLLFPEDPQAVPWLTLTINVAGSFVLGMLTSRWATRPGTPFWLRAGLGPGLLGSFTTFSSVVLSIDQLAGAGAHLVWLGYLALSLLAGLAAAWLGLIAGRRSSTRGDKEQPC